MTGDQHHWQSAALGPESLGEALRLLRHRGRVSRDELAQRSEASAGAISNYENDVSVPPAPTLRRVCHALANVLNVPVSQLWEQMGTILDEASQPRRPAGGEGAAR